MKRRIFCFFLSLVMLLALVACGAAAEPEKAAAEEAAPVGVSFSDAYLQYASIYGALLDEVNRRIDAGNALLESAYPDSYYLNSNYLLLVYMPFSTLYAPLGSSLRDDSLADCEAVLRTNWSDAKLTPVSPGSVEATYTYIDKTSGTEVKRSGRCLWECDGTFGSFRVQAWLDDELVEFTEFVPQGGNVYFLCTMTDAALITYENGAVTALTHAHRISSPALGTFPGDMRLYSPDTMDVYPAGTVSAETLANDPDCEYVLTLEDNTMTYSGLLSQDILDTEGNKIGVSWQAADPIVLPG